MPSRIYVSLVAALVGGFSLVSPPLYVAHEGDGITWRFSQAFAQSAGEITEKEAFDSAKELGTIEAWEAFLKSFPSGFRADLARAYVRRLGSVDTRAAPRRARQPVRRSATSTPSASPVAEVSPIKAFNLKGYYRLRPRSEDSKVLNNQSAGKPEIKWVKSQWSSGQWEFEEVFGTPYVRIKNRWKRTYLQMDGSQLDVSSAQDGEKDAHWAFETVEGFPYVRIKSRATGLYLVANDDSVEVAQDFDVDGDSHWQFVRAGSAKSPVTSGRRKATGKTANTNGQDGKIDCGSGRTWVGAQGKCVWRTNKRGYEIAPWKKPGCKTWERQCNQGNSNACLKYEQTCQAN